MGARVSGRGTACAAAAVALEAEVGAASTAAGERPADSGTWLAMLTNEFNAIFD